MNDERPDNFPKLGRMVQLDILRGIAILLVLAQHHPFGGVQAGKFAPLANFFTTFGWTGVDLFFVLSGFLVGGLLFEEIRSHGQLDIKRFLIRRAFKIWPCFYFYVFVMILFKSFSPATSIGLSGSSPREAFRDYLPALLNIQNYVPTPRGQLWSLAVEEHFYITLPLVLGVLLAFRGVSGLRTRLPMLAAATMIACLISRLLTSRQHVEFYHYIHYTPTHLRADSLAAGVLLAYVRVFRGDIWERLGRHRAALACLGIGLLAPVTFFDVAKSHYMRTFGFTQCYIAYSAILVAMLTTNPATNLGFGRWFGSRPARALAWVGLYSYPIYLWHLEIPRVLTLPIVINAMDRLFGWTLRWPLANIVYVVASIVVGVTFSKMVEGPALALRERVFPRRGEIAISARRQPRSRPFGLFPRLGRAGFRVQPAD